MRLKHLRTARSSAVHQVDGTPPFHGNVSGTENPHV